MKWCPTLPDLTADSKNTEYQKLLRTRNTRIGALQDKSYTNILKKWWNCIIKKRLQKEGQSEMSMTEIEIFLIILNTQIEMLNYPIASYSVAN